MNVSITTRIKVRDDIYKKKEKEKEKKNFRNTNRCNELSDLLKCIPQSRVSDSASRLTETLMSSRIVKLFFFASIERILHSLRMQD